MRDEYDALFADMNKPSLEVLSYALRHPDTWPRGFSWDYSSCNSCACGLAGELWQQSFDRMKSDNYISQVAREFAMPFSKAEEIFDNAFVKRGIRGETSKWFGLQKVSWDISQRRKVITPEMVADDIDSYLAEMRTKRQPAVSTDKALREQSS